jgi:hypothetical protein
MDGAQAVQGAVRDLHHVYRGTNNVFRGGASLLPGEPLDEALARHVAEVRSMVAASPASVA